MNIKNLKRIVILALGYCPMVVADIIQCPSEEKVIQNDIHPFKFYQLTTPISGHHRIKFRSATVTLASATKSFMACHYDVDAISYLITTTSISNKMPKSISFYWIYDEQFKMMAFECYYSIEHCYWGE